MADQRDEGINWVKDEQLWVDCDEDPTAYVLALRRQGRVSPPHDRPIEYEVPNPPTSSRPTFAQGGFPA